MFGRGEVAEELEFHVMRQLFIQVAALACLCVLLLSCMASLMTPVL